MAETIPTGGSADGAADAAPVVLHAEGIAKTFSSRWPLSRRVEVLSGADLEVRRGEIVGIVGANGSGKSTLLRILVGALAPDAGTVSMRGAVGWCPQEQLLYDRLTIDETFQLFGVGYGMAPDAVAAARDRLADRLDFVCFRDQRIDRLSGGNRQKVNLAIALLHDPAVLLLDEPYTAFDWRTYQAFWELTDELVEHGTAVVVISHLINARERFDRICEVRDGRLGPEDT